MKKSSLKLDLVIALMALVIGIGTMAVYIYQARIMSKQQHASVWPFLEVSISQGQLGTYISVENKGVGPAIVKSTKIQVDSMTYQENQIDEIILKIVGKPLAHHYTTVANRVMKSGEAIRMFHIENLEEAALLDSAMAKHMLRLSISYCSIYDECWTVSGNKLTPCENCEE
ncbi:MAG: hypothetical protein HYZ44_07675 [Bacteroidetes bacterium]|nr:hypothetical protein [Bacteroidota bacterium]